MACWFDSLRFEKEVIIQEKGFRAGQKRKIFSEL